MQNKTKKKHEKLKKKEKRKQIENENWIVTNWNVCIFSL